MNFHSYQKGYAYFWDSEYNQDDNVIKMGVSGSLADRKGTYKTGSYRPGEYLTAIEFPRGRLKSLDNHLKDHFAPFHRYLMGGGTEYYTRSIIGLLEPHLQTLDLNYRVLSMDEIEAMKRTEREMNDRLNTLSETVLNTTGRILRKINAKKMVRRLRKRKQEYPVVPFPMTDPPIEPCCLSVSPIIPFPHQQEVLDRVVDFYEKNDIGRLNWACGLGKSMFSIFAVEKLGFKTVLFGVSSLELQGQFREEILKIYPNPDNILLVGGDNSVKGQQVTSLLMKPNVSGEPRFVITTYHSCYTLLEKGIEFDFKVGDESHHLVGVMKTEEDRGFRLFHKIPATKTLFMTATEKVMDASSDGEQQVYTMDDPTVFGELLDMKTVQWAIENGKITDYNLCVLKSTEDELNQILSQVKMDVSNALLFISCYMCLKTLDRGGGTTHLLLYTNTTAEAELAQTYMDKLMEYNEQQHLLGEKGILLFSRLNRDELYNRALHSRLRGFHLKTEVERFKEAVYGVIPCVYIFGEGFDLPKLNGVCISGNMESIIRIIQYLLRPNRLERGNPDKKASIIIPYIETEDWTPTNKGGKPFDNVMNISFQLRNVDLNMAQKIRVLTLKPLDGDDEKVKCDTFKTGATGFQAYEWSEDVAELNQLKMRLKRSKVLPYDYTEEEDEYKHVRSINILLNIQSMKEYHDSQKKHGNYIPNPKEYFRAHGVWRDLYDFLGTDTSEFIPTKEEWKQFCRDNRIDSLEDYVKASNGDFVGVLPKEPSEYSKYVGFTNIPAELAFMKRRR